MEPTKERSKIATVADRRRFWASLDPAVMAIVREEMEARERRRRAAEQEQSISILTD